MHFNCQNILSFILKISLCFLFKYSLVWISNAVSLLQVGMQASAGGPAGQEATYWVSRLGKVKSLEILAVFPRKLCSGGSWPFPCSPGMLPRQGGRQASVGKAWRPSKQWSSIPSLSSYLPTLIPVLIPNGGHQLSLSVAGWGECCLWQTFALESLLIIASSRIRKLVMFPNGICWILLHFLSPFI